MKGFTVAEARARFGDLLDDAEEGETVVIERRGVRFLLRAAAPPATAGRADAIFEWLDPAVEAGQWTWTQTRRGAAFKAVRGAKKKR